MLIWDNLSLNCLEMTTMIIQNEALMTDWREFPGSVPPTSVTATNHSSSELVRMYAYQLYT